MASLTENLIGVLNAIWKSRRGRHLSGVWVHSQVASADAKYLSAESHQFVNDAFRE